MNIHDGIPELIVPHRKIGQVALSGFELFSECSRSVRAKLVVIEMQVREPRAGSKNQRLIVLHQYSADKYKVLRQNNKCRKYKNKIN